ncbi:hypothetical protein MVES1_001122 [Malassezia vespertilionis]|uniref:Uncharacterized protein n=1 Tax=Malassezia vespertilionis TaxID=2020962 RepID=A0A2N1JE76_9BASI|nr:uncharacterized protein MVES1_001122 [Malassezia vespertilionis]PKI84844.1 hypothetical protein MVES_001056 [Malassezia vespertilionis]WFD05788.1 hypothetical protein MVES1_001122 [Malassezia vespertilionis]
MADEVDQSFDDAWWDSLEIDPVIDTQLQVAEQKAQPSLTNPSQTQHLSRGVPIQSVHDVESQVRELHTLHAKQQEVIGQLTRQTQQQQGEIAVVRSNWSKLQHENAGLQQQQGKLELEYRQRLERIQHENRRQIEKLETAAAFRRIEQDTTRTAWPSTIRRRPPVVMQDLGVAKQTPSSQPFATPTRSRMVQRSPQSPISPFSLLQRKRGAPADDEFVSPSQRRAIKIPCSAKLKKEFPHFQNSFLAGPTLASGSDRAKSPPDTSDVPDTALSIRRGSSPSTPSPDLLPTHTAGEHVMPDAATNVLTVLFCFRTRWITHVMCQPYMHFTPPETIPGTQYLPLGPGVHSWCDAFDAEPSVPITKESPPSMLLHLLSMRLPPQVPLVLRKRFAHAADTLWSCVMQGSSYNVFLAECGHLVDDTLRERAEEAEDPSAVQFVMDSTIAQVWHQQADTLFGTVAAALRTLAGVFLRLNMMHHVSSLFNWMAALCIAHPDLATFLVKRFKYLDWVPEHEIDASAIVPSSQDETDLALSAPSSQESGAVHSIASDTLLATPVNLVSMLIECVRKTHVVPLEAASPESLPQPDQGAASTPAKWDMGTDARTALLTSLLRLVKVIAWTNGPKGLHEMQTFFQKPGVLLTLLDAQAPCVLFHAVQLFSLLVPDPLVLHTALSSQFDTVLQPRVTARLLQVRFPVVDILAKHLVDRRGNASPCSIHRLHSSVLIFLAYAARYHDTSLILTESVPLLPALIQCLSWDTEDVWSGQPSNTANVERALERVCLTTRLLHQLYMPETHAPRNLAEQLLSPQVQAMLNGIRHAFVVAMGRIAFAREPEWLADGDALDATRQRRRGQLENAAALAGDLVDLILSPTETDEIYELLTEAP